jgi:hypothetical protein
VPTKPEFDIGSGTGFVITSSIDSFVTPWPKLWGQLGFGCNKWVVQMAKPLNSDLTQRARVSMLETKESGLPSKSIAESRVF